MQRLRAHRRNLDGHRCTICAAPRTSPSTSTSASTAYTAAPPSTTTAAHRLPQLQLQARRLLRRKPAGAGLRSSRELRLSAGRNATRFGVAVVWGSSATSSLEEPGSTRLRCRLRPPRALAAGSPAAGAVAGSPEEDTPASVRGVPRQAACAREAPLPARPGEGDSLALDGFQILASLESWRHAPLRTGAQSTTARASGSRRCTPAPT
jgi:hypothetical protein